MPRRSALHDWRVQRLSHSVSELIARQRCILIRALLLCRYYLDTDLVSRSAFTSVIWDIADFVTVQALDETQMFQAFMGATPKHIIVLRYLELFETNSQVDTQEERCVSPRLCLV